MVIVVSVQGVHLCCSEFDSKNSIKIVKPMEGKRLYSSVQSMVVRERVKRREIREGEWCGKRGREWCRNRRGRKDG